MDMGYDGFLIINKPEGYTSHQVVAKLRKILGMRRIGHTGTLDPMATGVLLIALGAGTKLIPYLQEERKIYRAKLVLGLATDTQDITGEVIASRPETNIGWDELNRALQKFTGPLEQIPPMYSAVKLNGRPLYKMAREGKTVSRKSRPITIYSIEVSGENTDFYRFKEGPELIVECSKGTYIRTLCHDIGDFLGCGACLGSLVRLSSGSFTLEKAYSIEDLTEAKQNNMVERMIVSPVEALHHLHTVTLSREEETKIRHGNYIPALYNITQAEFAKAVSEDGGLVAILKRKETDGQEHWQPVRVLNGRQ